MKISYLHIRNYKQFSDLELDLTYPKGHAKAGEPLDKICIIGQSGTGKTNLLDIIKKSTINFAEQPKDSYLPFSEFVGKDTDDKYIRTKFQLFETDYAETFFTMNESKIHGELLADKIETKNILAKSLSLRTKEIKSLDNEKNYFVGTDKNINLKYEATAFNEVKLSKTDRTFLDGLEKERENIARRGIGVLMDASDFKKAITDIDMEIENLKNKYIRSPLEHLKAKNFIDRNIININESNNSWKLLKANIDNFDIEKTNYTKKLSNKLLSNDSYSKEDFKNDMALWEEENENLLEKIADDINSIIKKFNLELQIDEDTQSYEELKIKDLSNNTIIKYDDLSTGTKNLLSTFIPLKSYKPKDSIILIDEPEMSFYPDIQRQLVELYTTVGENNQLVVATHSPLIASSFEPWEVVELKFDKKNQICRELYYPKEEENHVDNYTVDPRMLTWTSILTDVFDIKEDSNFSFREKKLMEYATLKAEIKSMEDKTSKEANAKIKQFKKLSALLGLQN